MLLISLTSCLSNYSVCSVVTHLGSPSIEFSKHFKCLMNFFSLSENCPIFQFEDLLSVPLHYYDNGTFLRASFFFWLVSECGESCMCSCYAVLIFLRQIGSSRRHYGKMEGIRRKLGRLWWLHAPECRTLGQPKTAAVTPGRLWWSSSTSVAGEGNAPAGSTVMSHQEKLLYLYYQQYAIVIHRGNSESVLVGTSHFWTTCEYCTAQLLYVVLSWVQTY